MKTKQQTKKIALFGGSFNPIHNRHIQIIKEISKRKIVDEVWILPCKNHAFAKKFAPAIDRVKMIKLGIKEIKSTKICDIELKSHGKSYMINTIKKLKAKYPHKFFLVAGSDILYEIKKWHKYKELLKEVEFVILKRLGYAFKEVPGLKIYKKITSQPNNISSTDIREKVKKSKSLKKLMPLSIIEYIKKKGLYQ